MGRAPITIAAAALLLFAASCGRAPLRNARIDPALEKLIPPDTTMLFDAHIDRLRNTPAFQKYVSRALLEQSRKLAEKTGIDPARDIDEVLSCSDGKRAVVFTRFNRRDVASKIQSSGAAATAYKGVTLYADGVNAIAFVDPSIAVAASAGSVRSVIDGAKDGRIPEALRPVVDSIAAEDQILAAMVGGIPGIGGSAFDNPNFANLVRLAQSIESASLGMRIDTDVRLHARADCRSEEDSRQVHDALRGFIALGRLAAPANRPELLKIYEAITVTREKTIVRVTAIFSEQDLQSLQSLWQTNRSSR